jgi:hypothetical protein
MGKRTIIWLLAGVAVLALQVFGFWLAGIGVSVRFVPAQ